jgi:CRISPR-associated protein Csy2
LNLKRDRETDFRVNQVGVVVHDIDLQARPFKGSRTRLKLTGNPLTQKGDRPSFIEEGRCHLEVSLLLSCETDFGGGKDRLLDRLRDLVHGQMRLAGGEIVNTEPPRLNLIDDDPKTLCRLIPGWVLMERRDLMHDLMQASARDGRDALDAMHDALAIRHQRHVEQPASNSEGGATGNDTTSESAKVHWTSTRHQPGFIVPIATGYQAVTPVQTTHNARDRETPHRLAESVLTLGEFVLPLRLNRPSEMLWRHHNDGDLYVCQQQPSDLSTATPSNPSGDL